MRFIQFTFSGIRALAVPFLLPWQGEKGKICKTNKLLINDLVLRQYSRIKLVQIVGTYQLLFMNELVPKIFKLRHFGPTDTHVPSLAACQRVLAAACTRVNRDRFADDETILHQFTDLLACKEDRVENNKYKDKAKHHHTRTVYDSLGKAIYTFKTGKLIQRFCY